MKTNKTAKEKVYDLLRKNTNKWVPGYKIASPAIGGSEGLRRLRDLRQDGLVIEKRKMDNRSSYEYRLIK